MGRETDPDLYSAPGSGQLLSVKWPQILVRILVNLQQDHLIISDELTSNFSTYIYIFNAIFYLICSWESAAALIKRLIKELIKK